MKINHPPLTAPTSSQPVSYHRGDRGEHVDLTLEVQPLMHQLINVNDAVLRETLRLLPTMYRERLTGMLTSTSIDE